MGDEQERVPEPLSGALGRLFEPMASLIATVVRRRDPSLADRLESSEDMDTDDRDGVEQLLADELSGEISGPDWEPTQYGRSIEQALDELFLRYPND